MNTASTFTLLTIEQHNSARKILADHFHGQQTTPTILQARNGQEALELFRQNKPDLLLLDIQLPEQDGFAALSNVIQKSPHSPIIIISDHKQKNDILNALRLGTCGYLPKSFPPHFLSQSTCHMQQNRLPRPESSGDLNQTATKYLEKRNLNLQKALAKARKETQRERETAISLGKTNRILENIFNSPHNMIAYLDPNCKFIMVNEAYAAADNRSCPFYSGKNYFDLYPNEEKEKIFTEVLKTGKPYSAAAKPFTSQHNPEQDITSWDWSLTPTTANNGQVNGLVLCLNDVTDRIRLEEELTRHQQHLAELVDTQTTDLRQTNEILQEKIAELEQAKKEVEENKARYRRITEATSNYIYTVRIENGQAVKTTHRPACEAVTGYNEEEFNNDPYLWIRMVPEEDHLLLKGHVEQILQGKTSAPIEHRIYRKDGALRWIKNTPVPHYDQSGNLIAYEGVVQDITDRKLAEQQLHDAYTKLERRVEERTAKLSKTNVALKREIAERLETEKKLAEAQQAAEKANTAKSRFLANMSHEIRTPMNAIIGLTEVTLTTSLNDVQHRYLQLIKSSASTLLELLNDILDFSKIEAGQVTLEKHPFDLQKTIEAVIQPMAMQAHRKNMELLFRPPRNLDHELIGDNFRLRQILINLVGNALKFTLAGQVIIEAKILSENDSEVEIHFTVTDTGIGIKPGKLEEIFGSFTQEDSSTTRIHGGTGLGLAISEQLVGLMGGDIWVESTLLKGSTFHFSARFGKGEKKNTSPQPALLRSVKKQPVLILGVNPDSLSIIEETINDWGLPVLTATNGLQAMSLLEKHVANREFPRLIVVDEAPGTKNGLAIINFLRIELNQPELPLLLLTSPLAYEEASQKCRAIPNCSCLTKPASQQELRDALCAAFTGKQQENLNRTHTEQTSAAAANPLQILLVEDNRINSELAQIILEQAGHRVTLAENGIEAMHALCKQDFDVTLMDVQMPELDGITATTLIRQCEERSANCSLIGHKNLLQQLAETRKGKHLPIVAMTAHAMADDQKRCLEAGMDQYISKPFVPEQVFKVLNNFGNLPGALRHPAATLPEQTPSATETKQHPLVEKVQSHFAKAYRLPAAKIRHLLTASSKIMVAHLQEVEIAIANGDSVGITRAAHTLKGLLLSLGLKEFANLACRIESNRKRKEEITACIDQLIALRHGLAPLLDALANENEG